MCLQKICCTVGWELWMKFICSYTDFIWDLFIGYSHEKICCKPSVVSRGYEWSLFIAAQKINKHTDQLISVNSLGLAHKTIQFDAIKFVQKYYQPWNGRHWHLKCSESIVRFAVAVQLIHYILNVNVSHLRLIIYRERR